MCMSTPKAPKPPEPLPPPPPPAPIVQQATPLARDAATANRTAAKKRQGRSSLRLKRNSSTNAGGSGSGVNA